MEKKNTNQINTSGENRKKTIVSGATFNQEHLHECPNQVNHYNLNGAEELWSLISNQLSKNLGSIEFKSFFEEILPLSFIDKKLFLQVDTPFNKLWIINKYTNTIKRTLYELNLKVEINFVSNQDKSLPLEINLN
jgi:hypothetical protein